MKVSSILLALVLFAHNIDVKIINKDVLNLVKENASLNKYVISANQKQDDNSDKVDKTVGIQHIPTFKLDIPAGMRWTTKTKNTTLHVLFAAWEPKISTKVLLKRNSIKNQPRRKNKCPSQDTLDQGPPTKAPFKGYNLGPPTKVLLNNHNPSQYQTNDCTSQVGLSWLASLQKMMRPIGWEKIQMNGWKPIWPTAVLDIMIGSVVFECL